MMFQLACHGPMRTTFPDAIQSRTETQIFAIKLPEQRDLAHRLSDYRFLINAQLNSYRIKWRLPAIGRLISRAEAGARVIDVQTTPLDNRQNHQLTRMQLGNYASLSVAMKITIRLGIPLTFHAIISTFLINFAKMII